MTELTPYLGFLTVSLMIALTPGPSWAYTISTTLSLGRGYGMIGNLGNSTGIFCHSLAVASGIAAVLQVSTAAFLTLKFLGVFYLIYLALQTFCGGSTAGEVHEAQQTSSWKTFRNGAYARTFNPENSLLMLALLPQFVSQEAGNPEPQVAMGASRAPVARVVHTHLVFSPAALRNA